MMLMHPSAGGGSPVPPPTSSAYPATELQPALDENRPEIGPNLASDPDFCKAVAQHIYRDRLYPYYLQQQRMWETWDRIDDAFRVKQNRRNIDISGTNQDTQTRTPDGKGTGITRGISAKVTPSAMHKQIVAKTDLHMSIAYSDGIPVACQMPETVYEHPLYQPTQQCVDAANEELRKCARDIDLKQQDRKGRGSFAKYGHTWVGVDFRMSVKVVPCIHRLPMGNMMAAQTMVQQLSQQYGGPPQIGSDGQGFPAAIWQQTMVEEMSTTFEPHRMDAVFIDQTLPAGDMRLQACPIVRSHINREMLYGNDYDPKQRPFGWLNCNKAMAEGGYHYALTGQDEGSFRDELKKKYGLTDQGQLRPWFSMKQLWTAYPQLAVYQDPQTTKLTLDTGDGVTCPMCQGAKQIPAQGQHQDGSQPVMQGCPQCQGVGKIYPRPQRFVVQMFGQLGTGSSGGVTVLRIQRNPTPKDKVPLLFSANLSEDTSGAIPLSKSEAALDANDQLATAYCQYFDAKNEIINNKCIMPDDHPMLGVNIRTATGNVPHFGNPDSIKPFPTPAFDVTTTILPFINMMEDEVSNIQGMVPQLLGQIAPGRRPASEMQNAFDAAKMPIAMEVDQYNKDILGGWARFHIDNIEAWADREWIRQKTGRTTFGKMEFFTDVADSYVARQAIIGNLRYMLEASVNDPSINRPVLWKNLLHSMKMPDADQIAGDGGVQKGMVDAMGIINQILGKGIPVPPLGSEPHQLYIQIFNQALLDPYWHENAPQNLQLLQMRVQLQQNLLQLQQMQALQQQIEQERMTVQALPHLAGPRGQPQGPGSGGDHGGNKPATPNAPPANAAASNQQTMGAAGGAPQ